MQDEKLLKEIAGVFDGKNMIVSDGCSVMVPENYASKSMMIVGTELVYRITNKRSYFKQTFLPPAQTFLGEIVRGKDGLRVEIKDNGFIHHMPFLEAFRTFYKLTPGDEVVVACAEKLSLLEENWCVIENKIS